MIKYIVIIKYTYFGLFAERVSVAIYSVQDAI